MILYEYNIIHKKKVCKNKKLLKKNNDIITKK